MKYVLRDENGKVKGFTRWPSSEGQERLADDDPEILAYRARNEAIRETVIVSNAALRDALVALAEGDSAKAIALKGG